MKEVKLPSGATLKIGVSPFAVSKALYQAVLKEAKGLEMSTKNDVAGLLKSLMCVGFSSREIEACLWESFKKCTYNSGVGDLKIDADTFEPVAAREDYVTVCIEVAQENISPFLKSLYAVFAQYLALIESFQA